MPLYHRRANPRHQHGAVAIILGLTIVVLIGFAGLAIDLGRFFVIKSELQNAMDACALAAASQLRPGQNNANALNRAVAYGRVFTTGGVSANPLEGNIDAIRNRVNFQSQTVNVQPENITFAIRIDEDPYQSLAASDPNTAAFVQCSLPLANIPILFFRVLNPLLETQTVAARAVATLAPSASACAIPVAVCRSESGVPGNNFGLTVGQWMTPPEVPGSAYGTGNFGWIDFSPTGGGNSGGGNSGGGSEGAPEITDLLRGEGQCSVEVGHKVGQGGDLGNNGARAWNSRFGVYMGGGGGEGNPNVTSAAPDLTGRGFSLPDWSTGFNAYSGAVVGQFSYLDSASNYRVYQGPLSGSYSAISSSQHQSFGRSRRVTVAPIVDCGEWNLAGSSPPIQNSGGANPPIDGWACVLMLHPILGSVEAPALEFLGLSTNPGSPCATNGAPGTFGPLVPQLVQ